MGVGFVLPTLNASAMLIAQASALLLLAWLGQLLSNAVYHVFVNPLRRYPGPKLWAASRIPYNYHNCSGTLVNKLCDLHERYGPVVRIAPTELSYISAGAWKPIYGYRKVEMGRPKDGRSPPAPSLQGADINSANEADHKRIRQAVSYAFSERALGNQESLLQGYVSDLISGLRRELAQGKSWQVISDWYTWTFFDILGDLAFGEPFGCVRDQVTKPWVLGLFNGIRNAPILQAAQYYGLQRVLLFFVPKSVIKSRQDNQLIAQRIVERRISREAQIERPIDFISFIFGHSDKKSVSRPEIYATSYFFMLAGTETVSSLMEGVTFHLLKHQEVYDKLVQEIRTTFARDIDMTIQRVGQLEYLTAVLKEALRIYPPIPLSPPRMVPEPGEVIDGQWVAAGTAVAVNHHAAYNSSANFHRAKEFRPERWFTKGKPLDFEDDNTDVYMPFSTGPRNCIGQSLAWAETRLVLARVLWAFDMELAPESSDWDRQKVFFVWDKGPLKVKLTEAAK